MSAHLKKVLDTADKITAMAEDAVRGLDLVISAWPGEFRAIIWDAVADIASRRAAASRLVSRPHRAGDSK
jgi:hypothetical protein